MFKNYLRSAFRFWKHNKVFAFINAMSLSIALAVSFIIMLYVVNEYSYDRCHSNFKRIFRVLNYIVDYKKPYTETPYVLASALKDEYPQVEKSISVRSISNFKNKSAMMNIFLFQMLYLLIQKFLTFSHFLL